MLETVYGSLQQDQQRLLDEAARVMETAYNPYSHFFVGASLLSQNGQIITGSNVENAAFGSTICAERGAILSANAMGIRRFYKVAVIGRGDDFETEEVVSPCGSCRQMLYESAQISEIDLEVIMANTRKDKIVIATIGELLPLAFGPVSMGVDITKY